MFLLATLADKIGMCLTIPKKVVSIGGGVVTVKNSEGKKQKISSIIKVKVGDNVLTQNNVIIQKISKIQAKEINNLFNSVK